MAQQPIELILVRHLGSLLTTPVFVVDVHGDLVYFNEPAEDVLGIRFVDVRSMRYEDWTTAFRVSGGGLAVSGSTDPLPAAVPVPTVDPGLGIRRSRCVGHPIVGLRSSYSSSSSPSACRR